MNNVAGTGIKDFVPQLTEEGYEEFSALISRANSWLQSHTGISSVSLQSVMVPRQEGIADLGRDLGIYKASERSCIWAYSISLTLTFLI